MGERRRGMGSYSGFCLRLLSALNATFRSANGKATVKNPKMKRFFVVFLIISVILGSVAMLQIGKIQSVHADSHSITANCAIDVYSISASAGPGGLVSPSGLVTVNYGANQVFNVIAYTNFHIVDVMVDGFLVGALDSYTFRNVVANHTINATFAPNTVIRLAISAPAVATAGNPFIVAVTAYDQFGNVATNFAGIVTITSSDPKAVHSDPATLANGAGTFTITLKTAGTQSITATSNALSTSQTITVNPGSLDRLVVTPNMAAITAKEAQTFAAIAFDHYANILGDVTSLASWSINSDAGGAWNGATYTSGNLGGSCWHIDVNSVAIPSRDSEFWSCRHPDCFWLPRVYKCRRN
jgi:hypothetical protein